MTNEKPLRRTNKISETLAIGLFWVRAFLARYFGLSRFGRIEYWIYGHSYAKTKFQKSESRWLRDKRGNQLLLNPHSFIDGNIFLSGDYEPSTRNFIESHVTSGAICFDIGANIGLMTIDFAKKVGPKGQVLAFEPHPEISKVLSANIERNNLSDRVQIFNCGLADANRAGLLHTFNDNWSNKGMSSLVSSHCDGLDQKLEVPLMTLDRFVADHEIKKIDYIKVDIQGAELLFLKGAKETLTRLLPCLIMEISSIDLSQAGLTAENIFDELIRLGYQNFFNLVSNGFELESFDVSKVSENFDASAVICRK